jgi:hypothetical protein
MSVGKSISSEFLDKATSKMPPTPISGMDTGDQIGKQPQSSGDNMAKKHEYSHSTIHHHHDGSHTIHHHHESGDPKKDVEHAVMDHDGMMDSMQQHLGGGAGEPAEEAMEAGAGGGGMAGAV